MYVVMVILRSLMYAGGDIEEFNVCCHGDIEEFNVCR